MNEKYLVVNSSSSSFKFTLYEMPNKSILVNGSIEGIGKKNGFYNLKYGNYDLSKNIFVDNHKTATKILFDVLIENKFINNIDEIKGIGHKIISGVDCFNDSIKLTDEIIAELENQNNKQENALLCIKSINELYPNITQVGVFDSKYDSGISKYNRNKISHKNITNTMKRLAVRNDLNIISCNISSATSINLIKDGNVIDSSDILSPIDSFIIGTKLGNKSLAMVEFISHLKRISIQDAIKLINTNITLNKITTENDIKNLIYMMNSGDLRAKLAIELYTNSIVKSINSHIKTLNNYVNAIVFTGNIIEDFKEIRELIIKKLSLNNEIYLDINENNKNIEQYSVVTTNNSRIPVFIIRNDENIVILEDMYFILKNEVKTKKLIPNK